MLWELLSDVRDAVKEATAHMVFREPHGARIDFRPETYRAPLVVIGQLPPKRQGGEEQGEDYPFVIVRQVRGKEDEKDGARTESVTLRILCGVATAGDEAAGDMEIDVLLGVIRRLLGERRLWGGKRWVRTFPISWEFGVKAQDNIQPHPYHGGYVEATFDAVGVLDVDDAETLKALGLGDD